MADRVLPYLRLAVLCQRVESDALEFAVALIEPLHTIGLLPEQFGQPLTEMFLYSQFEDAVGSFELSVRIEDENRDLVPQSSLESIEHTFDGTRLDRIIPFKLPIRLPGLVFPSPGLYYFVVRADTQSLHQRDSAARVPMLRVLEQ